MAAMAHSIASCEMLTARRQCTPPTRARQWHAPALVRMPPPAPPCSLLWNAWLPACPCQRSVQCCSQAGGVTTSSAHATYQVLLAMVSKLYDLENISQAQGSGPGSRDTQPGSMLNQFLQARPEAVSVPFLSWMADQEAAALPGPFKEKMALLCERLVVAREVLEQERFDELYANTLTALSDPGPGADAAAQQEALAAITFGASNPAHPVLEAATSQPQLPAPPHRDGPAAGGTASIPTPGAPHAAQASQQAAEPRAASQTASGDSGRTDAGSSSGDGSGSDGRGSDGRESDGRGSVIRSSGGSGTGSGTGLVALSDPREYALRLSAVVTGQPVALSGYGQLYDAVLDVAPPATLSPEGLARAHQQAEELRQDIVSRRKSTVASILGRTKVTPEQAAQLMGGSAPSRILDLLLSLGSFEERQTLLPDCFAPPLEEEEEADPDADTDALWCTPAQLLSEIEGRLKAMGTGADGKGVRDAGVVTRQLASGSGQLVGAELKLALEELNAQVRAMLLDRMDGGAKS